MASFAELNDENKVLRVVLIGNDVPTSNGLLGENDMHPDGEVYCKNLFGGFKWKQTSFSGKFRKRLAGFGTYYNENLNMFVVKQPYPSWTLDNNGDWNAPIAKPSNLNYENPEDLNNPHTFVDLKWNEEAKQWEATRSITDKVKVIWNPNTLSWV